MISLICRRGFQVSLIACLLLFSVLLGWGQAQTSAPKSTDKLAAAAPQKPSATQQPPAAGKQQAAPPQQPAANPQEPAVKIVVPVERVQVPFVVIDSKNRYVSDLTKEDFTVYENGKKVPIDYFSSVTTLPLRAGLLIDTSNSVRLQWGPMQEAAIDFASTLLPDRTRHKAFLMTFDTTRDIVKDFTSDPNDLAEAIRKLKPGGGTSLFDAIYQACQDKLMKENEPGGVRRVLLLITDGEDDASKHSIEQTIDIARRGEVSLYAISTVGYNQVSPGDRILERLTEETGGYTVYPWKRPPSADYGTGYRSQHQIGEQNSIYEVGTGQYAGEMAKNLAMSLAQIHKELTSQYVIGYAPPNPGKDGKFREVKVVPRDHDYQVRARKGYYPTR
jgi:Ca-activated chloride channel homolog